MPPNPPEKGTQTISSFFKRKPPKRPATESHSTPPTQVLVLDSSDDDDTSPPSRPSGASSSKRPKLEPQSEARACPPTRATSTSPASTSTATLVSTAAPSRAPTRSLARLQAFSYTRQDPDVPPIPRPPLTREEQETRDEFVKKLVGNKALTTTRKSSYLEPEHYLAATQDGHDDGLRPNVVGIEDDDDDDGFAMDEDSDGFENGDESGTSSAKGKGKGKGKAKETEDGGRDVPTSRLAKFSAKSGSTAKSTSSRSNSKSATPTGSSSANVKYTPLELQVEALRKENPGVLLCVEVGYKFKFFQEDAQIASRVLNIACFPQQHMLTASIPTHRLEIHVRRLLNAGHKVGVVRQQETAALKKISDNRSKPFTRALSNLYTSATYVDELGVDSLGAPSGSTATLLCVVEDKGGQATRGERCRIGIVAVMPSTGEVVYDEFDDGLMRSELETRMLHLQPSELLLQSDLTPATESMIKHLAGQHNAGSPGFTCRIERIPKRFTVAQATSKITEFYAETKARRKREMKKVPSEIVIDDDSDVERDGGGSHPQPSTSQRTEAAEDEPGDSTTRVLDLPKLVLVALSALIAHLSSFNLSALFLHTSSFSSFSSRTSMTLNGNTIANLELLRNSTDYSEEASLISVLDKCKTAMGKRLLRKWISKPLVSIDAVNERLDAISEIHASSASLVLSKLRDLVRTVPDLERGLSRIHFGRASPNELMRVLEALQRVGSVFDGLEPVAGGVESYGGGGAGSSAVGRGFQSRLLREVIDELPKVKRIVRGLVEQVNIKSARDGKKDDLFENEQDWPELRACKEARDTVEAEIEGELKHARKVLRKPALQFKKVSLEEYLIEVKVSEKNIVPADWLRINGTKAYYRFRSPALQRKMQELEQARERLAAAANAAYLSFLQEVASHYAAFRRVISALSTLDCLFSLSMVALSFNYVRPTIVDEPGTLDIVNGRHPIIEQVSHEPFVPNSLEFREGKRQQMILTGLNMGGKSSLSKSVALIALMAQIGSFVPAEACKTSLFDGIYTRMGAFDSLARGRSTFMVELTETSEILKLATPRSLIVLDELGRGTSTNDGEAIASAVLEWIATVIKAVTVFVTHYPNLAALATKYPDSITTNHMACLETPRSDGHCDVTFLYKLVDGLASASHGLNVARLADLPPSVLDTALRKRQELERIVEERVRARREKRFAEIVRKVAQGPGAGRDVLEMCKAAVGK